MKKLFTFLMLIALTVSVFTQAPQKLSYQAVIRNSIGQLVTNQAVGIRLSILQGSSTGTAVYVETQTATANANGLASIEIGGGTPVAGTFVSIDWSSGLYFIKTETDPTGGTNYIITGASQILSVPYALYSQTADYNSLSNKPTGNNIGDLMYWDGTSWDLVSGGQPGQILQLTALKIPAWTGDIFSLTTSTPSSITANQAISGGNVTGDAGEIVTTRGVCWSTSVNPTIANSQTLDGEGKGQFTSYVTGLTIATTYYLRAYASNSLGTIYGNEISFTTSSVLGIGDLYQGGIIAYFIQSSDPGYIAGETHGLIAAPSDQSTGSEWGCYGTVLGGADGTAIGTGNWNTTHIVAGCPTTGIAAKLCYDLILNGYDDWYLPSKDELNKLYINRLIIGGFTSNNNYWSSTEYNNNTAHTQHFQTGSQVLNLKNSTYYVRAIRAF